MCWNICLHTIYVKLIFLKSMLFCIVVCNFLKKKKHLKRKKIKTFFSCPMKSTHVKVLTQAFIQWKVNKKR